VQQHGGKRGNQYAKIPKRKLGKPSTDDIGLTSKQVHQARAVRDGESRKSGVIGRAIDKRLRVDI
jgi:hypothetical protein